ncbi:pre-mRNA splicing factor 17 [Culex quinquefasciatus]|uniref:Pre-mRNA splicing factor 17 n=1 Tax=Culex quinquefasciatus TaxID=7176 RepID=B0WLM6_CULQU|nr:pre-mRNA splicing factor 17 [Culex quinquefasciatus]|eukprot:XP_001849610.1 pre-mRNA splicing factor 17 [Culex quinquefasciatus]
MAKKQCRNRVNEDTAIEEKCVEDLADNHGLSFLHPPHDVGVNSDAPNRCFLPHHIHTWIVHSQGISGICRFPRLALLLLSDSPDQDLGDLKRAAWRNHSSHRQAVRKWDTRRDYIVQEYDRHLSAVKIHLRQPKPTHRDNLRQQKLARLEMGHFGGLLRRFNDALNAPFPRMGSGSLELGQQGVNLHRIHGLRLCVNLDLSPDITNHVYADATAKSTPVSRPVRAAKCLRKLVWIYLLEVETYSKRLEFRLDHVRDAWMLHQLAEVGHCHNNPKLDALN